MARKSVHCQYHCYIFCTLLDLIVSLWERVTCICVDENVMHPMIYNIAACLLADYNWREVRWMQTTAEGFTMLGIWLSGNIPAVLFVNCSNSNRAEAKPKPLGSYSTNIREIRILWSWLNRHNHKHKPTPANKNGEKKFGCTRICNTYKLYYCRSQ